MPNMPGISTTDPGGPFGPVLSGIEALKMGATPNPSGSNMMPGTGSPSTPLPSTSIGGGLVDSPIVPGSGGNTGFNINTGPTGTFNPTSMAGLNPSANTGIPAVGSSDYTNLSKQLDGIFGSGMGSVLLGYLSGGGGFNPQVAQALQNANIPQEQRALANIREAFGARGLGGGSNEALATGDYESAFNLGQEGILANLYQGGANNIQNMISGVLNTAFLDKSNKPTTLDTINSILPILAALGLTSGTGGGGSSILGGLLKSGIGGLEGLFKKLFGIGGNPDMGNPNTDPTLSLPIPGMPGNGNDVGAPPFDPLGGIPGISAGNGPIIPGMGFMEPTSGLGRAGAGLDFGFGGGSTGPGAGSGPGSFDWYWGGF